MFSVNQSDIDTSSKTSAEAPSPRWVADPASHADYFFIEEFDSEGAGETFLAVMPPTSRKNQPIPHGGLPAYLAHLWTLPLLNKAQEQHCFRKLNYLKYLLVRSQSKPNACVAFHEIQDDSEALRESIVRVRNFLVESNLRLVVSVAKRHGSPMSESFDELVSVGNTTLLRAVDLFDYRRGIRFSTYAYQAIERSIFTLFRRNQRYRKSVSTADEGMLEVCQGDAGESDRVELEADEASRQVTALVAELDDRDRYIVMARFGINRPRSGVAFHVIAKEVQLSTTRTVQLFNRSIEKMRLSLMHRNAS